MIRICARATFRSSIPLTRQRWPAPRFFSGTQWRREDPRLDEFGRRITDEFAEMREKYDTPKHTIILAHGLLGFDELRLAGHFLPGLQYWRGITEALSHNGIEVIVAAVPPSGSIEARAAKLAESIAQKAKGKQVNIIAHSMGGLDSRYMISRLRPTDFKILSLTTIASPHRGSAFADYMFDTIGPRRIKRIYKVMEYFGFETGAFSQLTQKYMAESFNPRTPDIGDVKYYSYGASLEPNSWSVFAASHAIVKRTEGLNDGLVSIQSSQWGDYKGTLIGVSHLDLINWTNRLKWWLWSLTGSKRNFNAIAFYLDICDMLAKEGLPVAPFWMMLFQDASIFGICFGKSGGSGQFATIKCPGDDDCRGQYLAFGVGKRCPTTVMTSAGT
ncbi:hypothetical protein HBI82_174890 [Parastagonospora nodorum]|nr:hypothetical protein HBH50_208370 [Parastagonospora nodorum]KAH4080704.1 hypothetical protein HBH48_206960 [Parastagonospora nodorum]KAH4799328.1 hypothetical protein HBH61_230120 [Parastagonospora nodorum]KAH4846679.1 hypothetical protein HBH75_172290 [Parastagonospora nodorum]KAH4970449.1 hypothetical protein HBI78_045070 [Parastagonospora nodorum]